MIINEYMKAIILAAGKGSRISDKIGVIPKSTLKINGKPIIRTTVEVLLSLNIQPVVCIGFQREKIIEALDGLPVEYYYNPFYEITNNIASLWFAQKALDDSAIILSADIVFQKEIIELLIRDDNVLTMVTDNSRVSDGDYFFTLSLDNKIEAYGPDIPFKERSCEYVGISKIDKSVIVDFRHRLNELIDDGKHHIYFEYVFFSYINDPHINLTTIDVSSYFWQEIDFYEDYQRVLQSFEK
jgi:choline kinase